jgi:hypothetical protein
MTVGRRAASRPPRSGGTAAWEWRNLDRTELGQPQVIEPVDVLAAKLPG